jgi:hypothetical protein
VVSRMTLFMSIQRWVNSESTQTGGSILESAEAHVGTSREKKHYTSV